MYCVAGFFENLWQLSLQLSAQLISGVETQGSPISFGCLFTFELFWHQSFCCNFWYFLLIFTPAHWSLSEKSEYLNFTYLIIRGVIIRGVIRGVFIRRWLFLLGSSMFNNEGLKINNILIWQFFYQGKKNMHAFSESSTTVILTEKDPISVNDSYRPC